MSEPEPTGGPDVVFYWRPGCVYCWMLRRNLLQAGVTLDARNIWDDPDAAAFVRSVARGTETVPTAAAGGSALVNPPASTVLARLGKPDGLGFRRGRGRLWNRLLDRPPRG